MQVRSIVWRVKGIVRVSDYARRWGMLSHEAQRRLKILVFCERHGLSPTLDAFAVSRRTLYYVFPYPIEAILTDNGSEFMKDFRAELEKQLITPGSNPVL